MKSYTTKGRKPKVNQTVIIDAALSFELSRLSMHSLGKALDVSATALYRHVGSKEKLIFLCCDTILRSVPLHTEFDHWSDYFISFAKDFRELLLERKGSVDFVRYNQQLTPASGRLTNHVMGILRNAGFKAEDGFLAFVSVFSHVTDMVQQEEQFKKLQSIQNKTQPPKIDESKLPHLAWLIAEKSETDFDVYFENGLDVIIEGLKVHHRKQIKSKKQ